MLNRKYSESIAFALLRSSVTIVVIPVIFVVYTLLTKGWRAINWEFLTQMPANGSCAGGISGPIVGTLILIVCTIVVALPLGLFSAIYLSEYARPGMFTRLIRLAIVNLAGVPSIVYGLFGLGVFVLFLKLGTSILAGSLTLALLILPVIIVGAEEALTSVPQSFREASYALGATKWQTIRRIVIPNALPGIITGSILGISRAAGETAPILFTVATAFMGHYPHSLKDPVMALPYHLFYISTQGSQVPPRLQWGTALVLLGLVLGMNLVASIIRIHYRRKQSW